METGTDCYIDPSSSLDHSSTSFASWLGLLNRGSLRAQPSASWFWLWHSYLWRPRAPCLYCFLMPTCFRSSSAYLHRCISWLAARGSIYNSIQTHTSIWKYVFDQMEILLPHTSMHMTLYIFADSYMISIISYINLHAVIWFHIFHSNINIMLGSVHFSSISI